MLGGEGAQSGQGLREGRGSGRLPVERLPRFCFTLGPLDSGVRSVSCHRVSRPSRNLTSSPGLRVSSRPAPYPPPLFLGPPGSLRSLPPPPQSAVFVFIAVRAHVALLPKGIVSLTPAFRTPTPVPGTSLAARGRERPVGLGAAVGQGHRPPPRSLRGPAPLGAPFSESPPPRGRV